MSAEYRQLLDELVARAIAYRTGKEFRQLVEFSRRFPHIAPFNAMLLHVQNPGIQYALRAKDWEQKYHRRVKPGARPYVILQTMGPVAFVFDLSDTEPVNPSFDPVPAIVANPFSTKGQPSPNALHNLISACAKMKIHVEQQDLASACAGRVFRAENHPFDFYLQLNSKHTEAQKVGTAAHELAHIFCGHLGSTETGFWPDRRSVGTATKEFEAEAVAYIVTSRANLDIGSVQYLAGYLDNQVLPGYSLDTVLKCAGQIEDMIVGTFRLKKSTRPHGEHRNLALPL